MVAALVVILVILPILEIAAAFLVAHFIGWIPTLLILVAGSAAGIWIVKIHGLNALRRAGRDLARRRLPGRTLLDGALAVLGGVLLVIPGFLTALLGIALMVPFVRFGARTWLVAEGSRRIAARSSRRLPRIEP